MNKITVLMFTGLLLVVGGVNAETPQKAPADAIEAWRDARFGMFIHWGPSSLSEKEISWSRKASKPLQFNAPAGAGVDVVYDNLYKKFNPVKYDAREWVAIAKGAGMKYMVLTAKHHDGFSLWPSKARDYSIAASPYKGGKGDIVKELADACHEAGMRLGLYYSPRDWTHPDYGVGDNAKYEAFMKAQVTELLSQYGTVDVIWWDGFGRGDPIQYWHADRFLKLIRTLQPKILSNDRCAVDTQLGSPGVEGDFYTPEQRVGGFDMNRPWESCMTVSAHNHWSWGGAKDGVKPLATCLRMLIYCAGGDGNMLLNVGPTPEGEIAAEQASRLKEMGAWLAKYGESIYGTRGGPYMPGKNMVSTRKGNSVYVHVLEWPKTGEVRLPALPVKITSATLLTGGGVEVVHEGDELVIKVAAEHRQAIDTLVKLEIDKPAMDISPIKLAAPGGKGK